MYNEMHLKFISKRNNIAVVRNMVGAMVIEYNPTITYLNELKTVISEAITNAIVHGYNNEEDKYIDMDIVVDDNKISLDIIDKGVGIEDVEQAKEPLFSTKSEEERSGLGFTIMQLFCDELVVDSMVGKGTKLHLEKKW